MNSQGQFFNGAVMQRRTEAPDSLDYFPTPPWATRAFLKEFLLPRFIHEPEHVSVSEPACGEGHMAHVLREFFPTVHASDVWPYGHGAVADFLSEDTPEVDWIITNPPFNRAAEFAERAMAGARPRARIGCALLLRLNWLQALERQELFRARPFYWLVIHHDRVPMHKGRWEPAGTTMTPYAWVIWTRAYLDKCRAQWAEKPPARLNLPTGKVGFIAHGARERHMLQADIERFGHKAALPLMEGAAT